MKPSSVALLLPATHLVVGLRMELNGSEQLCPSVCRTSEELGAPTVLLIQQSHRVYSPQNVCKPSGIGQKPTFR